MVLNQASSFYRAGYALGHQGSREPQMFAFRLQGKVAAMALGARLRDLVLSSREVESSAVVVALPEDSEGPRAVVLGRPSAASGSSGLEQAAPVALAAQGAKQPWSPIGGTVTGQRVGAPLDRQIQHTLIWADRASIDAFGGDAYEHDFKLYNDAIVGGRRPVCLPHQQNDFWAVRDGAEWDWNFPAQAGPYSIQKPQTVARPWT